MGRLRRRMPSHNSHLPRRMSQESLETRQLLAADLPEVAFHVTEQWNNGFTANLKMTNDEARTFTNWQVEFDLSAKITSLWNATLVSSAGNHYVVKHPSWDADLSPGEVVTIGFVADGSPSSPTNVAFPGVGTPVDTLPAITISDANVVEGNSSQTFATFQPGETSKFITVPIVGDTAIESGESFLVRITGANGARLADSEAIVTIADNDTPVVPSIVADNVTVVEGPGGTNARFVVRLAAPVSQPVQVNYQTRDGSARAGLDYAAKSGLLTFAPGETSKTVDVTVLDDVLAETSEGFYLDLSFAGSTSVAKTAAATITDNDTPTTPGVSTQLRILDDWGTGFTAEVTITNNGTTPLTNWRLAFAFGGAVSSTWNGTITSRTGEQYVLSPAAWNATIPPGGSVTVGFVFQRTTVGSLPTGFAISAA